MNQISATGNSTPPFGDATSLLTTVHLVWLAVLAVLVVLGIVYGARLKRRRVRGEREASEHAREAGVAPAPGGGGAPPPATPAPPTTPPAPQAAPPAPPAATPASATAATGEDADDPANGPVGQLKGLGPKVAARLAELGVTTVGQIAALDHDGAQALDAELGPFRGRLERDRWVEQARFLAAGDRAGFEAVFGRL